MRKSTIYLILLAAILLGGWYLLYVAEKGTLSVPVHHDFFMVDSARVDSIAFKYATWTYLSRVDGEWHVHYPELTYPAAPSMISQMFEATNGMVLENVIATKASKHDAFKIDTTNGAILQFFERGEPVSEIVLGKRGAGIGHTFVRSKDSDSVYLAQGNLTTIFRRAPSEWFNKVVFSFDSSEVKRVQWMEESVETIVERGEDRIWHLSKAGQGTRVPLDTALLNLKLMMLCPLRAEAIYASDPPGVDLTLDEVWGRVILTTYDGRADTLLWHPIEHAHNRRTFAYRPERTKPIFMFSEPAYDRLFSRYNDLLVKDTVSES
jgi:hypothetical protein